ncbi:MAG: guanylate kinase [Saccharofermentans sp.]|nr:guanylate kinase [Saccharofermentans sp.]
MSSKRGLIVAVSGPSGVGKGTVLGAVEEFLASSDANAVGRSISATTRKPRGNEQDGVEYYFKTVEEFESLIEEGEIIEYDKYCDNYYGTPAEPVRRMIGDGKVVLFDITIEGSLALKRFFPEDCVTIFILPPSMDELESRLRGRGTEADDVVKARMDQASKEIARAGEFEFIVTNNQIEQARDDILSIIRAEGLKKARQ